MAGTGRPHVWRSPVVLTGHLHSASRSRCGYPPRVDQHSRAHRVMRSAFLPPTRKGSAPPMLPAPPDPGRHGLDTAGKEVHGNAIDDEGLCMIVQECPPALGRHTVAWRVIQMLGHVL